MTGSIVHFTESITSDNVRRLRAEGLKGSLLFLTLILFGTPAFAQQASVTELEARLKSQYQTIEKVVAAPPSARQYPVVADYKQRLREWQDDLAQSFAAAGMTISEILKMNPPNPEFWQERLETMQLYSAPVGPPEARKVFGSGEVQQSAQILDLPAADYPVTARAAKMNGDVRLRLVLAADRSIKYVFPVKSTGNLLTESAMSAARQIKFEPAVRNGKPVSQFLTVVYEFRNGKAQPPYIPKTVF